MGIRFRVGDSYPLPQVYVLCYYSMLLYLASSVLLCYCAPSPCHGVRLQLTAIHVISVVGLDRQGQENVIAEHNKQHPLAKSFSSAFYMEVCVFFRFFACQASRQTQQSAICPFVSRGHSSYFYGSGL